MKSIFDTNSREALIQRIKTLKDSNKRQWGTMSVYQMVKHCRLWEEMMLGKTVYKRAFLGRLFGRIALRNELKDAPMRRSTPTIPELKISGNGILAEEIEKWIQLLQEYGKYKEQQLIHPFFGSMTKEQIGYMAYKHTDHHLRQFNA